MRRVIPRNGRLQVHPGRNSTEKAKSGRRLSKLYGRPGGCVGGHKLPSCRFGDAEQCFREPRRGHCPPAGPYLAALSQICSANAPFSARPRWCKGCTRRRACPGPGPGVGSNDEAGLDGATGGRRGPEKQRQRR